ncbi:MAG: hypothetical protein IKH27_04885 [Oscillospiraceae bacterium]|nr:hypothetical protein [Oscillospiraceae bacterium]
MKNEAIIAAWDSILPEQAAAERMCAAVTAYQQKHCRKARRLPLNRLLPAGVCLLFIIAGTAAFGIRQHRLSVRYTAELDNGQVLVYGSGSPAAEAQYAYDFDITDRALTADEMQTLFPGLAILPEYSRAHAAFRADTGEMLRLETAAEGGLRICLARAELPVTDTVITGEESCSEICGTPVKTGYFLTRANSRGIRTAIFYAEFPIGGTTVYTELAGNEADSEQLCVQLSDTVYRMICAQAADVDRITAYS